MVKRTDKELIEAKWFFEGNITLAEAIFGKARPGDLVAEIGHTIQEPPGGKGGPSLLLTH